MDRTKIYITIPWNTQKNIGVYYNDFMEKLDDDEWACFIDGDACFTTEYFGKQLEDIIAKYPECGLFTCKMSRIACVWQKADNPDTDDMEFHREFGQRLAKNKYDLITDVSDVHRLHVLNGTLILISKKLWNKIGKCGEKDMLGIDNDFHWRAQAHSEKVYLMEGVYIYHWYRGGTEDLSHLI